MSETKYMISRALKTISFWLSLLAISDQSLTKENRLGSACAKQYCSQQQRDLFIFARDKLGFHILASRFVWRTVKNSSAENLCISKSLFLIDVMSSLTCKSVVRHELFVEVRYMTLGDLLATQYIDSYVNKATS